jgi:hypothetical protein
MTDPRHRNDPRHQNAVTVAEKVLDIANRHRDPRVRTLAILKKPIAEIAVTIAEHVEGEVQSGNTNPVAIAQGIYNDLYQQARRLHAEDVVEQLLAFAALHPHPGVKSIAVLKRPAAQITVYILDEVDKHVTAGTHQAEKIAKAILNSLLGGR